MRRADRLFQIALLLGRGRVMTAQQLADVMEVSERTIYRDIADLIGTGAPIDGEAGVGYLMRGGYHLPPLMFSSEELQAMTLGMRMVKSWGDAALGRAAQTALAKIEVALPADRRAAVDATALLVPDFHVPPAMVAPLAQLRDAMNGGRKVRFAYRRRDDEESVRTVWPVGLLFWGNTWTLGAWCELRQHFRTFRIDRINGLQTLAERFDSRQGQLLREYLGLNRD